MSSVNCLGELFRNCSPNNHKTSHNRKQETLKYEFTKICFMVCGFNLVFKVAFLLRGLLISVKPPLVDFAGLSVKVVENTVSWKWDIVTIPAITFSQRAKPSISSEAAFSINLSGLNQTSVFIHQPPNAVDLVDLATRWIPPPTVSHNSVDWVLLCKLSRLFICLLIENNPEFLYFLFNI